jgi:uncharacterized protein with HEPN domain
MPSDPVDRALRDIFHHIDLAAKFVEEMDRETFRADLRGDTVQQSLPPLRVVVEAEIRRSSA